MLYQFRSPVEMGIYVNAKRKTLAAVKSELGADVLCNFQLFNGNWTACCFTKAGGKVIADDGYIYEGFGWNGADGRLSWDVSRNAGNYENFAGCLTVVKDGKYPAYNIPAAIAGKRGRTAIGTKADGTIVLFCCSDAEGQTVPQLADRLIAAGCRYAVNFDGGGSSQCSTPEGAVKSSRIVHTLFWGRMKKEEGQYPALAKGSRGRAVKSLQTLLASWGYPCGRFGADGEFGAATADALLRFQKAQGLAQTVKTDAALWTALIGGCGDMRIGHAAGV